MTKKAKRSKDKNVIHKEECSYENDSDSTSIKPKFHFMVILIIINILFIVFVYKQFYSYLKLEAEIDDRPFGMNKKDDYYNDDSYFNDNTGFIKDKSGLTYCMKEFFRKTDIKPYLVMRATLNSNIDGINPDEKDMAINDYATKLYDSLYKKDKNGKHLLVLYVRDIHSLEVINSPSTKSKIGYSEKLIMKDYFFKKWTENDEKDELSEWTFGIMFSELADITYHRDTYELYRKEDAFEYIFAFSLIFLLVLIKIDKDFFSKFINEYRIWKLRSDLSKLQNDLSEIENSKYMVYKKIIDKPIAEVKDSDIEELKKKYNNK